MWLDLYHFLFLVSMLIKICFKISHQYLIILTMYFCSKVQIKMLVPILGRRYDVKIYIFIFNRFQNNFSFHLKVMHWKPAIDYRYSFFKTLKISYCQALNLVWRTSWWCTNKYCMLHVILCIFVLKRHHLSKKKFKEPPPGNWVMCNC